jgi:ATP-dependent Clp protease ATP-binding subunit ClpB
MTSNIGAHFILEKSQSSNGKDPESLYIEIQKEVLTMLRQQLKPEFLNRIDEVIVFHSLGKEQIREIVNLQVSILQNRLEEQGLNIEIDDKARDYLAEAGYDNAFGARPLKRIIQKEILDQLAIRILEGNFGKNDTIKVIYKQGKIQFNSVSRINEGSKTKLKENKFELNETLKENSE